MQYRYPSQPKNEDAFEEFCLVLLREHWSLSTLNRYGRRGERQHGVDLLDTGGSTALRAVQCKHHDATKTLPPRELEAEVAKAKTFPQPLAEFYILTTAKKSAPTQRKVRAINRDHAAAGLFTVHLLTWDDIERLIDNCPTAQEFLSVPSVQARRRELRQELQPIHDLVQAQAEDIHGSDLEEVANYLKTGEFQLAIVLLRRIRNKSWNRLSAALRSKWCTLFADAELREGNDTAAVKLLLEAKVYQPDDEISLSNEIVAYELLGNSAKAFDLGTAAAAKLPHSATIYAAILRTAPSYETYQKLFDERPDQFREDPEVWAAAAARDEREAPLSVAEVTARRAVSVAADDARAWGALGAVLLRAELDKLDPERTPSRIPPDRARVTEARMPSSVT